MLGTTNISTSTVKTELSESTYNIGKLCTSSKINIWAKYKPVPLNSIAPDRSGTWYKGDNGLCGLNIPNASGSPESIYNSEWTHDPPKGGSASPYRLADFGRYNGESQYLFTTQMQSTYDVDKDSPKAYISCIVAKPNITNNLQVTDCDLLSNFRLAIKIDYDNKSYIITSANKASEVIDDSGILQCIVDFSSMYNGNSNRFVLTSFLTTDSYPTLTTFPTVITCYALPNYLSGYTNRATATYAAVTGGISFIAIGMANDINGTYQDEQYYARNPYNWSSHTYEYWKIQVVNTHLDKNISFNVDQFTWYGKNVDGKDVTNTYNDELKFYDSNKTQQYTITSNADSTMYIYVRTRILGHGATLTSSNMSTESFDNTIRGIWTNTAEGISNWSAGRFELTLYRSKNYSGGKSLDSN